MGVLGVGRTIRTAEILSPQRRCGGFAIADGQQANFMSMVARLACRDGAAPQVTLDSNTGVATQIKNLGALGPWSQSDYDMLAKIPDGEPHTFPAAQAQGLFGQGDLTEDVNITRWSTTIATADDAEQQVSIYRIKPLDYEAKLAALFRPVLTRGLLAAVFRVDLQSSVGLRSDSTTELDLSSVVYAAQASLSQAIGAPVVSTASIDVPSLAHALSLGSPYVYGAYPIPLMPLPVHTVPLQVVPMRVSEGADPIPLQLSLRLILSEDDREMQDQKAVTAHWFVRGARLVMPCAPQAIELRVHDPLGIAFAPARIAMLDKVATTMSQHFGPALAHYGQIDPQAVR